MAQKSTLTVTGTMVTPVVSYIPEGIVKRSVDIANLTVDRTEVHEVHLASILASSL